MNSSSDRKKRRGKADGAGTSSESRGADIGGMAGAGMPPGGPILIGAENGGNRPTLKTIARLTGLGVTTVSRALHDAPDIGMETKERVHLIARQIGYHPNRAGVRLRTGRSHVIGLVLTTETEELGINAQLVHGISEYLEPTAYDLIVMHYPVQGNPMTPISKIVESHAADGVIFGRTEPDDPRVRYLHDRGFPFATHGRTDMGIQHPYCDFDNECYAESAVEHLAALGRHRLALLGPSTAYVYARHMMAGFVRGIERFDLVDVPMRLVDTDSPHEQIQHEATRLMQSKHRPDGFICASAISALSVTAGAEAAGFVLGRDFDVVVKDSFDIIAKFRPAIQTVREDFRGAGRGLAEAVIRRIETPAAPPLQRLDMPEFRAGQRTSAPITPRISGAGT